jgi:hypothetical protein
VPAFSYESFVSSDELMIAFEAWIFEKRSTGKSRRLLKLTEGLEIGWSVGLVLSSAW